VKKLIVSILTLTLFIFNCSIERPSDEVWNDIHAPLNENEITEKIPVDKLHEDIDYFMEVLEEVHVNPYLNIQKDKFYSEIKKLKTNIDKPLTRKEFYQIFTPVVLMLKDSHTNTHFPQEIFDQYIKKGGKLFPIDITVDENKKVFVKNDYSPNAILPGTEIISINSIKSEFIVNKFLQYEKGIAETANIKRIQGRFRDMLWQVYDFEGPFKLKLENEDIIVEGMTLDKIEQRKKSDDTQNAGRESIEFKKIDENIGLLKVQSFWISEDEFNEKIRACFAQIKKDSIKSLIIDVRDNQGGSEVNGNELLQYITDKPFNMYSLFLRKKSKRYCDRFREDYKWWARWFMTIRTHTWFDENAKIIFGSYVNTPYGEVDSLAFPIIQPRDNPLRFKGQIFVLMNHYSYSATVGFLGAVKDYQIAPIVGTESGESPNGFGEAYYFDLPNSRLLCRSSTTFMLRPNRDPTMISGLLPDYKVVQKQEDTEKGVDTVLRFCINFIKSNDY
jgi:C-terminal processing protease CtpA/Prc